MQRRGGLDRTERLLAGLCLQVNHLAGGKAELSDFLPEFKKESDDIGAVFGILVGAMK